jgi:hypothetical protein
MMIKRTYTTPETSQEMTAAALAHPPTWLTAASCLYPCVPTAKPEQLLLREFRVADTSAHIPLSNDKYVKGPQLIHWQSLLHHGRVS